MSRRIERVNELIRQEIADLLHRVSIMGSEEDVQQAMAALRRASGYFRHEMSARLRLRHVPELTFKLDTSIQEGARVLELLREIEEGKR
mgnify:CR=1 FL=1